MRILNSKLQNDIDSEKSIKLDLGSGGKSSKRGFYSVDHIALDGVDIVANLNEPLYLIPDNSVDYIYSRHAFEHIDNLLLLMREIYRIIKKNGSIEIVVPHFSNVFGYSDPTHVRVFGIYTMYYFCSMENQPDTRKVPAYYTDVRFKVVSLNIEFYRNASLLDKIFANIFYRVVNHSISFQEFYERRISSLFHAWQIRYILNPEK